MGMKTFNKALQVRWLWRFGVEGEVLWTSVIGGNMEKWKGDGEQKVITMPFRFGVEKI